MKKLPPLLPFPGNARRRYGPKPRPLEPDEEVTLFALPTPQMAAARAEDADRRLQALEAQMRHEREFRRKQQPADYRVGRSWEQVYEEAAASVQRETALRKRWWTISGTYLQSRYYAGSPVPNRERFLKERLRAI